MKVRNLDKTPFATIMTCFLNAFENYFVEMPTDFEYYKKRWKAAKVRFDLSYGMFENEQLVGFIINGIDNRNGDCIAFNTGTGVLPQYRGKRIVKKIYEYALTDLKRNGITKCALEVIKENEIAIKSYKSIGFKSCRNYKCFEGKINLDNQNTINLKEVKYEELDWDKLPNQASYSWDNHKNVLQETNYRYFQVLKESIPQSYFVINSSNGYVAQLDSLTKNETSWNDLFSGIKNISEKIKINNIDEKLKDKIDYIKSVGLINTVDQYEMELRI